ncbi:MAG: hypothetical protein LBC53_05665 [Spirochaetaceae bacterium]|nr:hypothetical protein [Spirochaetaceae bacterium]
MTKISGIFKSYKFIWQNRILYDIFIRTEYDYVKKLTLKLDQTAINSAKIREK